VNHVGFFQTKILIIIGKMEFVIGWDFHKKIKDHKISYSRMHACAILYSQWKENKSIDLLLNNDFKESVNFLETST